MCGIFCELRLSCNGKPISKDEKLQKRIRNRGPDSLQTVEISVENEYLIFCGSVLWMQGETLTMQPMENEIGLLLYNGDVFDDTWNSNVSDTFILMDKLSERSGLTSSEEHITQVLKSLKGPFSLIYYDKITHELYFSRDKIGRSTMLVYKTDEAFIISSVLGRQYECVEVPATSIYRYNIRNCKIKLLPWTDDVKPEEYILDDWLDNLRSEQKLPDDEFSFVFDSDFIISDPDNTINYIMQLAQKTVSKTELMKQLMLNDIIKTTVAELTDLLETSVRIRLMRQPNMCQKCLQIMNLTCTHSAVGVLFSGGLDCTILALLADKYSPQDQCIDLINVAFKKGDQSSYDVPDRLTGKQSYEELKKICPMSFSLPEDTDKTWFFENETELDRLVAPVLNFMKIVGAVSEIQIMNMPRPAMSVTNEVMKWILREVNIEQEELKEFQRNVIADLVYPRQTILDESLGSALWFAARGTDNDSTSPCRVLLLGSGADELFGGYTRHRNAYKRCGWTGLERELLLDWKRISFRNLSRDNRVICDHGRQPRLPYLDEKFTNYVLNLKPWLKCFPSEQLGPGIGDKLMLRLVACNLGLTEAVTLPKRALQFGSRIANKKEKGSDVSKTFLCTSHELDI